MLQVDYSEVVKNLANDPWQALIDAIEHRFHLYQNGPDGTTYTLPEIQPTPVPDHRDLLDRGIEQLIEHMGVPLEVYEAHGPSSGYGPSSLRTASRVFMQLDRLRQMNYQLALRYAPFMDAELGEPHD